MTEAIVILVAVPVAILAWKVLRACFIPYKACPRCKGRGHCTRCGYSGKVLRFGARWVHPELRRK